MNETNACVSGSQTVPAGGCPIDGVNDTYTSPRYTPSAGSSSNEQFNLSGLIPGNNYFLVVDGNGGAISPLYIEPNEPSPIFSISLYLLPIKVIK